MMQQNENVLYLLATEAGLSENIKIMHTANQYFAILNDGANQMKLHASASLYLACGKYNVYRSLYRFAELAGVVSSQFHKLIITFASKLDLSSVATSSSIAKIYHYDCMSGSVENLAQLYRCEMEKEGKEIWLNVHIGATFYQVARELYSAEVDPRFMCHEFYFSKEDLFQTMEEFTKLKIGADFLFNNQNKYKNLHKNKAMGSITFQFPSKKEDNEEDNVKDSFTEELYFQPHSFILNQEYITWKNKILSVV